MNGFNKVLKFGVWGTFKNARVIADDIVLSLIKNSGLKEDEKDYLPTYTSSIKEDFLCWLGDIGSNSDRIESENAEEEYVTKWIIRIYKTQGNEGSKISVTQNKELRNIICQ